MYTMWSHQVALYYTAGVTLIIISLQKRDPKIPDASIKMLGRWKRDTYQCYIDTSSRGS